MSNVAGVFQVVADVGLKTIHGAKVPKAAKVFNIPRELIASRKRFVVIPEVLKNLTNQHYKLGLISTVDIKIIPRNQR